MLRSCLCLVLFSVRIRCSRGVSFQEQLEHIVERRRESQGVHNVAPLTRRTGILGAPNLASHLPEAEAILPGHTLIRPSLGMLKSSIKYPHRYRDNGAAVYGNINNLGIRYDNKNKWVLYSGFRRGLSDYIMVVPVKHNEISEKPRAAVSSVVLDDDIVDNGDINKQRELIDQIRHSDEEPLLVYEAAEERKGSLEMYPPKSEYIAKQKNRLKNPSSLKYLRSFKDELQKAKKELKKFITKMKNITAYAIKQFSWDSKNSLRQQEGHPSDKNNITVDSEEKNSPDTEIEDDKINKTILFWASKDAYNHIKLNQEAPKQTDLLPLKLSIGDEIRNWWFYHQDDYEPFEELND